MKIAKPLLGAQAARVRAFVVIGSVLGVAALQLASPTVADAECVRQCPSGTPRDGMGCCQAAPAPRTTKPSSAAASGSASAPAPVVVAPTCLEGMVRIPGGSPSVGSADGSGGQDEHPRHVVNVAAFCMDRLEVTLSQYTACTRAGGCQAPSRTIEVPGIEGQASIYWSRLCNANRASDSDPINCVDWSQAGAYCAWVGGRLPTEAEWEYAASGGTDRTFPWGEDPPSPTLLNGCGSECRELGRRLGVTWTAVFAGDDQNAQTGPVGSYQAGASPFGLLDMAGNVSEWTSSNYCSYSNAQCASTRVVRGGSWRHGDRDAFRVARREAFVDTLRETTVGFRCAKSL